MHQTANAAIAGFGFALGRDVYKATKASLRIALTLAVPVLWAVLPWTAGYFLHRRRGYWEIAFGLMAACLGYVACWLLVFAVVGFWSMSTTTMAISSNSSEARILLFAAAVVFAPFYLLGARAGSLARERDEAVRSVADHNRDFLGQHGIRETGGRDITHYDSEGNALRFIETHHDQMLFMVVGRRGRRASISLSPDGRMVGYSGV